MIDVYEQLLPSEKTYAGYAYSNLVNEVEITTFHAVLNGSTGNKVESKYFGNTTGSLAEQEYKAVIVKGDYTYPEAGFGEFSGLIIATGDVKVTKEFHGTILSGGTITLDQNVNVEPDRDAVLHALPYSRTIVDAAGETQEYHVVDFFNGGDGYLGSNGKSYKNSDMGGGDLLVYDNWQFEYQQWFFPGGGDHCHCDHGGAGGCDGHIHYIPDRQESPEMCGRNCDNTGADQSADPLIRTESGGVRYRL